MGDELWGEINIERWRATPSTSGHCASEEDVVTRRAVFYLENADEIRARPYNISLPHCATLTDEDDVGKILVIVIEAEQADDMIYIGYRYPGGGNGMCTLQDIYLLDEPELAF